MGGHIWRRCQIKNSSTLAQTTEGLEWFHAIPMQPNGNLSLDYIFLVGCKWYGYFPTDDRPNKAGCPFRYIFRTSDRDTDIRRRIIDGTRRGVCLARSCCSSFLVAQSPRAAVAPGRRHKIRRRLNGLGKLTRCFRFASHLGRKKLRLILLSCVVWPPDLCAAHTHYSLV